MEPDNALKNATVRVMLVIVAGAASGYINKSIGTRIKPPAAPIRVPKTPTNKPIKPSRNQNNISAVINT